MHSNIKSSVSWKLSPSISCNISLRIWLVNNLNLNSLEIQLIPASVYCSWERSHLNKLLLYMYVLEQILWSRIQNYLREDRETTLIKTTLAFIMEIKLVCFKNAEIRVSSQTSDRRLQIWTTDQCFNFSWNVKKKQCYEQKFRRWHREHAVFFENKYNKFGNWNNFWKKSFFPHFMSVSEFSVHFK